MTQRTNVEPAGGRPSAGAVTPGKPIGTMERSVAGLVGALAAGAGGAAVFTTDNEVGAKQNVSLYENSAALVAPSAGVKDMAAQLPGADVRPPKNEVSSCTALTRHGAGCCRRDQALR